jgi:hypothetical protein
VDGGLDEASVVGCCIDSDEGGFDVASVVVCS